MEFWQDAIADGLFVNSRLIELLLYMYSFLITSLVMPMTLYFEFPKYDCTKGQL